MRRISTATKVVDKFGAGKHGFTDGNASTGVAPTDLEAQLFDHLQEEICAVIEAGGIAVDGSARTQLLAALRAAGVFQTAVQFDSSTKGATTEFVQRALGNIAGVRAINAVTTLTAADAGKEIALFGSSGFALTLPLGSAVSVGTCLYFSSSMTAGNAALVRQGADTISVGTNSLTGITIYPGSTLTLKWNGAAWVASGESQLPYSPMFAASLVTAGYQKLPSGLILQWTSGACTANADNVWTFPIAFPNASLIVIAQPFQSSTQGTTGVSNVGAANKATVTYRVSTTGIILFALGY